MSRRYATNYLLLGVRVVEDDGSRRRREDHRMDSVNRSMTRLGLGNPRGTSNAVFLATLEATEALEARRARWAINERDPAGQGGQGRG